MCIKFINPPAFFTKYLKNVFDLIFFCNIENTDFDIKTMHKIRHK